MPCGKRITDRAERKRLASLAIPPAWSDVWICPDPNGHMQATARDAKGRKQYRYHPLFRAERDESKFDRMLAFSAGLPRLRELIERDLLEDGLTRRKLLATVVRLLDKTLIRIGNGFISRRTSRSGSPRIGDGTSKWMGTRSPSPSAARVACSTRSR